MDTQKVMLQISAIWGIFILMSGVQHGENVGKNGETPRA